MYNVYVPTMVEDTDEKSFTTLVNFDKQIRKVLNRLDSFENDSAIVFCFAKCRGLSTYAIAYMSVISSFIKNEGRSLYYRWSDATQNVKNDFERSGFIHRYFKEFVEKSPFIKDENHNAIQFQDFKGSNMDDIKTEVMNYINGQWFGNMGFTFDEELYSEMLGSFIEMFANAAEHSGNGLTVGFAAYGKINISDNNIYLCIVDRGVGIVEKVKKYWHQNYGRDIDDVSAMKWALQPNNTTRKRKLGGQGFSNMRQFLRANNGSLDIYANAVHARMDGDRNDIVYKTQQIFPGTILIFRLNNSRVLYFRKGKRNG